ncbi:MAG: mannose-phosphate guanylyltransferase [Actinomycetota bacterium]|nr:mannose-phosphate guanylyltransferase [Actinomycetota bacterium]
MQAVVLAGGEGTRLRPLTLTTPKPVMPLAGRPFLSFMLDWMARHGVDEALLALGYKSDEVHRVLGEEQHGMRLRYLIEDEPLGTAGPLRLAADEGMLAGSGPVLVVNGDCLTDFDLTAQLRQHAATGASGTIALAAVEDTASYGVVPTKDGGEVEAFLEKQPGPAPTNRINAGTYVLDRGVVDTIPAGRAVSIEREVFPQLVGHGLYGFPFDGYWIDIGTPERYLEATYDLLAGRVESELPPRDETDSLIYDGCITSGARIGPLSLVGRHCSVGDRSVVERAVLHDDVRVGRDCTITEAIVAEGARLEDRVRVEPGSIVGAGAVIAAGTVVESGARVEPGERVA